MTGPLTPDELQAHLVVRDAIRQHVIATKGKMPRRVLVSEDVACLIWKHIYKDEWKDRMLDGVLRFQECPVWVKRKWRGIGAMVRAQKTWVSSQGENTTA